MGQARRATTDITTCDVTMSPQRESVAVPCGARAPGGPAHGVGSQATVGDQEGVPAERSGG